MLTAPFEIRVDWTLRSVRQATVATRLACPRAFLLAPPANDQTVPHVHVPAAPGLPGVAEWLAFKQRNPLT